MLYPCPNFLRLSRCSITAALSTSISHVLTLSKGSNSVHMPHPCWRNLLLSTSYTPLLMFYLFSHGLPLSTCFTSVYPLLCPANQQVGPPPTPHMSLVLLRVSSGVFSFASGSRALGFCKAPQDNFDSVRCYINTDVLIFFPRGSTSVHWLHLCLQFLPVFMLYSLTKTWFFSRVKHLSMFSLHVF